MSLSKPIGSKLWLGAVANPVWAEVDRNQNAQIEALIKQLFGNGDQGAFYLPQPVVNGQQVLFQDAAGTIPVTADGDPTGRMDDLSGNGNHATQSNSAARPVYRTDGTLHWLEFDGVDDYMSAGDVMDMQDENFILAASFIGGGGDTAVVGKSQTASDRGRYFLAVKTYASFASDAEGADPTFTFTSGKGFTASLHRSISGGSLSTMINGAEISNRAMPAVNHNSSRDFEIGRYAASYEFHSGPIYGVVCVRGTESLEDSLGPIADTLDNLRGAAQ